MKNNKLNNLKVNCVYMYLNLDLLYNIYKYKLIYIPFHLDFSCKRPSLYLPLLAYNK